MFYISPYFVTHLPVFKNIQENVPFIIYLLIYILTINIGAILVYWISYTIEFIKKGKNKFKKDEEIIIEKEKDKQVTFK